MHVVNWVISFLEDRKQIIVVDGIVSEYLNINRGVPHGTVHRPVLFSIIFNGIKSVDPMKKLVKFADDMTICIPGKEDGDTSRVEVDNINVRSEKKSNVLKYEENLGNGCSWKCL